MLREICVVSTATDACMWKGICVDGDLCCIHCDIHSCQTLVWGRVFVLREICVVSTATDACMRKGICVDGDLCCIHCDRRLYEEGYLC